MKIDSAGNVWCCGPGGIHVFAPDSSCLGVIRLPEHTANICFGDDDLCSLYVTVSTSVYRMRVGTPGNATVAPGVKRSGQRRRRFCLPPAG
jgi:gluconolactonase